MWRVFDGPNKSKVFVDEAFILSQQHIDLILIPGPITIKSLSLRFDRHKRDFILVNIPKNKAEIVL